MIEMSVHNAKKSIIQDYINRELVNKLHQLHNGENISRILTCAIKYYVEEMESGAEGFTDWEITYLFLFEIKSEPTARVKFTIDYDLLNRLHEIHKGNCNSLSQALTCAIKYYVEAMEIYVKAMIVEGVRCPYLNTKKETKAMSCRIDSELFNQLREIHKEDYIYQAINYAIEYYVKAKKVEHLKYEVSKKTDVKDMMYLLGNRPVN